MTNLGEAPLEHWRPKIAQRSLRGDENLAEAVGFRFEISQGEHFDATLPVRVPRISSKDRR